FVAAHHIGRDRAKRRRQRVEARDIVGGSREIVQIELEVAALDRAPREPNASVAKTELDRNRIALVLVLAPDVEIAPRWTIGEHRRPIELGQAPFHVGGAHAGGRETPYDGAHAGRGDEIDRHAELFKDFEDADVREAACAAAGKYES